MNYPFIHIIRQEHDLVVNGQHHFSRGVPPTNETLQGCFAEWNWNGDTLQVQNCRYGFIPLYYFTRLNEICLSTSIPMLLQLGAPDEWDETALAVFVRLGFYLNNDTAFEAIKAVPPNSSFTWCNGHLSVSGGYYTPTIQQVEKNKALDIYVELFRAAIKNRILNNPIVLPLTGGRDSRHILFELQKAGALPEYCITAKHFPPKNNQDVEVAANLTRLFGIKHVVVEQPSSRLSSELRKNVLTSFCSDEHAQYLPVVDYLQNGNIHVFDGIGGDVLSSGLYHDDYSFFEAGDFHGLAGHIINRFSGCEDEDEFELSLLLHKQGFSRLSRSRAMEAIIHELKRHQDAPNPVSSFYFWNRIRREIALYSFCLWPQSATIACPYLDYELYDFLASIPAAFFADGTFHTEAINRAFPEFSHILFEKKNNIEARDYFKQFATETAGFVQTHSVSEFIATVNINHSLNLTATDGLRSHLRWMNPGRVIYFLQLENLRSNKTLYDSDMTEAGKCRTNDHAIQSSLEPACKVEDVLSKRWNERCAMLLNDFTKSIKEGSQVIIVDEDQITAKANWTNWRFEPFLQQQGQYWGAPEDDDRAIVELEKAKSRGAEFIALAWPTFWWLEHYKEWHLYLRSNFSCCLENERLVIFDLRKKKLLEIKFP